MKKSIVEMILEFIRQVRRNRRWQRAVTCVAALVVFVTTYALILPAITMEGHHPHLAAEALTGWAGDPLSVNVSAESPAGSGEKVVALTLTGEEAGLSEKYEFDENGVTSIIDAAGQEIRLHRTVREDAKDTVDYWFVLAAGQKTDFTLELEDEIVVDDVIAASGIIENVRTAKAVEEKAEEAETKAAETEAAETASPSNAVAVEEFDEATASDAVKTSVSSELKASASDADLVVAVENDDVDVDEDSGEILDGAVIDDIGASDMFEDEKTEVTAELKIAAGSGDDLEEAIRDAEKNAEKRGDASIGFTWRTVVNTKNELTWAGNGVNVTMFYNADAEIPDGAYLSVAEIEEGSDEYQAYYDGAAAAVNGHTEAEVGVASARFFDITILDADGNEIQPASQVVVKINYDNAVELAESADVKAVHFAEAGTEVIDTVAGGSGTALDEVAFNADHFSVFGLVTYDMIIDPETGEQSFNASANGVAVAVKAEAGAFPEGTYMKVERADSFGLREAIENAAGSKVGEITAVDITFYSADGTEIQPEKPINVVLSSDAIKKEENPMIVHVEDDKTEAQVVGKVVVEGKKAEFTAEKFSIYAIVGTELVAEVLTADGSSYKITVDISDCTNIPADAYLEVNEILPAHEQYENYVSQASEVLRTEKDSITFARPFDISIKKDGTEIEPDGKVSVSIELMGDMKNTTSVNTVHFSDDGPEFIPVTAETSSDQKKGLSFETDSFSVYVFVGTDGPHILTVQFKNGNSPIASMFVKDADTTEELKQIIYDPGAGTIPEGQVFKGWTTEENYDENTELLTIAQVRAAVEEAANGLTEDTTTTYYAVLYKHYTITYEDLDGVVVGTDSVELPVTKTNATCKVNMGYTVDDEHNFEGWNVSGGSNNINSASYKDAEGTTVVIDLTDPDALYPNGTEMSIKGDVQFTVSAPAGHWLIFDENGKGAKYNAPRFIKSDGVTVKPCEDSEMTRNGYTFAGWYTGAPSAAGGDPTGEEFEFGHAIEATTTVYAKWTPNTTAPYTVILWTQNVNRTGYEVKASYVNNNGTVGQNIPYTFVDNGDEDYVTGVGNDNGHYTGFCLTEGSKNQQVAIKPEGDSVLNLYFDRIEYNFKFYLYRNGTQNNRYDYANNSGNGSSLNDLVTWHSNQTAHPSVDGYTIQSETVGGRTYHYFVLNAYYGEDISSKWPTYDKITGANGREAVSYVMMVGTVLKPNPTAQGSGTVKGIITVLNENILGKTNDANGNYVVIRFPDNYNNWRYHIWFETVAGETYPAGSTHVYNGKTYYQIEGSPLVVRSSNTTDANQNEPKYTGFDYVTRLGQNASGTTWEGGHWTTTEGGTILYHLNYVYDRQKYNVSYFDGNYVSGNNNIIENRSTHPLYTSKDIEFGAVIPENVKNYVPELPAGQEGYVFEGWYIDEGCTVPVTWSTMPVGGITVYAKWRQIQYRVFLHTNVPRGEELSWGTNQALSFRVSYGEKVSAPTGLRPGYEFFGWYTDEGLNSVFNAEAFRLNETTVTTPYDKTEDMTDPEVRPWLIDSTDPSAFNSDLTGWDDDNDESTPGKDRYWITKKLDLYAKWSEILIGSKGINIVYDAGEGTDAPSDDELHKDNSDAVAGAASKAPAGKVFSHWVVQTWNGTEYVDTESTALPGQKFKVLKANSKITDSDDNVVTPDQVVEGNEYTYTVQLRAVYTEAEDATPTHIPWYKNDGTEAYHIDILADPGGDIDDSTLQINQAVDILEAPTREGYTFLGWARVPMGSTEEAVRTFESTSSNWEQVLGSSNVWLYFKDGNFYSDSTYTNVVTEIAADQKTPYHAMFAVWGYTVTVKKVVDSPISDDLTREFDFSASINDGLTYNPTTEDFSLANGEKKVYKAVAHGGLFSVTESNADGFDVVLSATDGIEKDASGNYVITDNTVITVTNTRKTTQIDFEKKDKTTGDLSGATFTLSRRELGAAEGTIYQAYIKDGKIIGTDYESIDLGKMTLPLVVGEYELKESKSPDGYIVINNKLYFQVDNDGTVFITPAQFDDGTEIIELDDSGNNPKITIHNEPGTALPDTGGRGTLPFSIAGLALMLMGAAYVSYDFETRRRRERRLRK